MVWHNAISCLFVQYWFVFAVACRPSASAVGYPIIHVENSALCGISDDDRNSGEYYSGDEFNEEDAMLATDRYYKKTLVRKCISTVAVIFIFSWFLLKAILSGHFRWWCSRWTVWMRLWWRWAAHIPAAPEVLKTTPAAHSSMWDAGK